MNGEISYHEEDGGCLSTDQVRDAIPHRQSTRRLYDGKVPYTVDLTALEQCVCNLGVRIPCRPTDGG